MSECERGDGTWLPELVVKSSDAAWLNCGCRSRYCQSLWLFGYCRCTNRIQYLLTRPIQLLFIETGCEVDDGAVQPLNWTRNALLHAALSLKKSSIKSICNLHHRDWHHTHLLYGETYDANLASTIEFELNLGSIKFGRETSDIARFGDNWA